MNDKRSAPRPEKLSSVKITSVATSAVIAAITLPRFSISAAPPDFIRREPSMSDSSKLFFIFYSLFSSESQEYGTDCVTDKSDEGNNRHFLGNSREQKE